MSWFTRARAKTTSSTRSSSNGSGSPPRGSITGRPCPDQRPFERSSRVAGLTGVFASNVVVLCAGAATTFIIARALGPVGRGIYAAVTAWPLAIASWSLVGLNGAALYWAAKSRNEARRVLTTALLAVAVPVLMAAAGGWFALPSILRDHTGPTVLSARAFLLVYLVGNAAWLLSTSVLHGLTQFAIWNRLRVLQALLWLAAASTAFLTGRTTPSLLALLFATSFVVCSGGSLVAVQARTDGSWKAKRALVRPLLTYGAASWAATIPQQLTRRLDQMVMTAFVAPGVLGNYALAAGLSALLMSMIGSIAQVALPRVARVDAGERVQTTAKFVRLAVIAATALALPAVLLGPLLIPPVFGSGYGPAGTAVLVLAPAGAIDGAVRVAEDALLGLGRPHRVLRAELVGLAVTVTGLAVTLPTFPLMGPAVTSLVACSAVFATVVVECRRELGCPVRDLVIPRQEDFLAIRRSLARGRSLVGEPPDATP